MSRVPTSRGHRLLRMICIAVFWSVSVAGQPLHPAAPQTMDVDQAMRPCTDLGPPPEGNEALFRSDARDGCSGECAKITTNIVDRVSTYFRTTWRARALSIAIGGVIGGLLMVLGVIWAERRRAVGVGALMLVRFLAIACTFGIAVGWGYMNERAVSRDFVAADNDLRTLIRTGVVPRGNTTANAHCAVQLELLLENADSPHWKTVAQYGGLFTAFGPMPLVAGSQQTREELRYRVTDMVRVLEGYALQEAPAPRDVKGVFASNEMLRAARAEWDRFELLKKWWIAPAIACLLALLVHWGTLAIRHWSARRRVERLLEGHRHKTSPAVAN